MITNDILDKIKESNSIAITFHTSPDGDSLGSALGLLQGIRRLNKKAYILSKEPIPETFKYLPCSEEITGDVKKPIEGTECVIVLDCGNVERISADLSDYKGMIIDLDHHVSNENYGHINFVDSKAAATCELSYLLIKELGVDFKEKNSETIAIGSAVYTGLVTDTGSFRHSNVTKRTHTIAAELIDAGIENSKIHSSLFDNKPFEKVKLMGAVLSNIELALDNKVAILSIPKGMLESFNLPNADTSDIISIGLGIKGVEVSMMLKEVEEGTKSSLRSKNDVDVRKVAEVFGGGGHVKAAGLMQKNIDLETAKENLLQELKKELGV